MSPLLRLAVVAAAYFVAGKLGLSLAYVNESTTAVWPPAGIAVASLLLLGPGAWPAVAAGAFAVNVSTSGHLVASIVIAAGNTLEALAGAWLARRFAGGRAAFDHTPGVVRFAVLAAFAPAILAATIGTGALVAADLAARTEAASIWLTWWLGDAAGIVLVAPLIVLWPAARHGWTRGRLLEAVALGASLAMTALIVFGASPIGDRQLPLEFLAIPLLLWSAFRFGSWATAAGAAALAAFAIQGTLAGFGPFVRSSPNESLLLLQAFISVIALVMLSAAAEISARREAEQRLQRLNDALEARVASRTEELTRATERLLEAQRVAHVGSWEWDMRSGALWWSDELYRIYGTPPDAPLSYETFLERVHPDDRDEIAREVERAAAGGRPFSFDHRIIRPDGGMRVLHGQGRVITDEDGRAIRMVGTGHDVTDRAAAEAQRVELAMADAARRDAEAASRAKDEFLAILSHELRTPLNVAMGWAQQLEDAALDARAARGLEAIRRNLRTLARLVADIVDVSRMSAGALTITVQELDAAAVALDAVEAIRDQAARRGVQVEARIEPPVPLVRGDAGRLQQVVSNLLSNAVKFTRDGGHVVLRVRFSEAVEIIVEDDGAGIDPAFLPHVFEPFRQGDPSSTREHGGLGLGLSIAKRLVDLHGGSIRAGNRPTGGAIFTVRLPAEVNAGGSGAAAPL